MPWQNLHKLLRAVSLLSGEGGARIKDLQRELQLSRRSAYRLIDTLESLRFPIYDERVPGEREKRWRLDERYIAKLPNISVPELKLTPEEVMLLGFLFSQVGSLRESGLAGPLESLRAKLSLLSAAQMVDAETLLKLDSLFAATGRLSKDYRDKGPLIDSLIKAVFDQKRCHARYRMVRSGKTYTFDFDPLKLIEHDGGLYVFVRMTHNHAIRILAVERILELQITTNSFEYPTDFDADALLQSAFNLTFDDPISVAIRFSAEQAPYILERRWALDQTVERQNDGGMILRMTTSGVFDVKRWVLSFGSSAQVLEPISLARQIGEEAGRVAGLYSCKGSKKRPKS